LKDNRQELGAGGIPADMDAAKLADLLEKLRSRKLANDEKEGQLTNTQALIDEARPGLEHIRELVFEKLTGEMPKAVAGFDIPQVRVYGTRLANEIVAGFADIFSKWKV
jgi:hypothetical protein